MTLFFKTTRDILKFRFSWISKVVNVQCKQFQTNSLKGKCSA